MPEENGQQGDVTSPTGTQAVDRAARLLIDVVQSAEPVTFTQLASTAGLAKSTTSRLLDALERNGLVGRDEHGRFRPGDVFVRYAWRGGGQASLVSIAQPVLGRLGDATGETVNLGVASRGMVEQIAQVDSRYLIGGTNWLGLSVPLHCAALGKVLLAYGAAELPPGRLAACAPRTITSRAVLEAHLADVRSRGYAITDEELEPGLVAVAAPVYTQGAAVVAALSVSGPATRLTRPKLAEVAASCVAAAAALSAVLGHRPDGARTAAGPPLARTAAGPPLTRTAAAPRLAHKEGAA